MMPIVKSFNRFAPIRPLVEMGPDRDPGCNDCIGKWTQTSAHFGMYARCCVPPPH
jgi:hypothetical protein